MFQKDVYDKPFVVTDMLGHKYGRFDTLDEAISVGAQVLKQNNYQDRIFVKWYDLDTGFMEDHEIYLA